MVHFPWFYYVGKVIMRVLLFLLTRLQVKDRENIPSQGPVIIIANHLNIIDPPLLSSSLSRRVIFMAKKELFRFRVISYLIRNFGSFPVHRGQFDRQASRQTHQVLAKGLPLAMFPEGKRSPNAQLQSAFPGSALIASHNRGIPIIPVGISGTEKLKGKTWLLRRPQITVNIGSPFYLPPTNSKLTKPELVQLTTFMMEHIAELLPTEYRGSYAGKGIHKHES
ncbi:lysophospholipid acyltransferase family protein [Chloroflexota bacterium]